MFHGDSASSDETLITCGSCNAWWRPGDTPWHMLGCPIAETVGPTAPDVECSVIPLRQGHEHDR